MQYIHGSGGCWDDGDVFSFHGDGPGDMELGGELSHHHVPEEVERKSNVQAPNVSIFKVKLVKYGQRVKPARKQGAAPSE